MDNIAVLFARKDSIYKTLPGCDVFDIERDARTFSGRTPVIAHPPCRAWGKLAQFAKPAIGEKELGLLAVEVVRRNGGVLEHPAGSGLWRAAALPEPGRFDQFGGWSTVVNQSWFGHRAEKATLLYIVGIKRAELPTMAFSLAEPTHTVTWTKRPAGSNRTAAGSPCKPRISVAERERTPIMFAHFLMEIAMQCRTDDNLSVDDSSIRKSNQ